MQRVVLASNNQGKLKELKALLSTEAVLLPQSEFRLGEVAETGLSFIENALIKARHACTVTELPALADDSGIEVDALNGEPGIYSARYAGVSGSDADAANNDKLLRALSGLPDERRSARFRCVIVFMRHARDPMPLVCQGSWEGRILHEARGSKGFGYDPLFYVPTHDCSSAELDPAIKNSISHRGQALEQLRQNWNSHR